MESFWNGDLDATVAAVGALTRIPSTRLHVASWLAEYDPGAVVSSNAGAIGIPFQRWLKFKEAFSPKFVVDALASLTVAPRSCLDPFGGSGTTALTCSLLGIRSTTIEVNPFLADLIRAKVTRVDPVALVGAYERVVAGLAPKTAATSSFPGPASLREPGVKGRYVFSAAAFDRIQQIRSAIRRLRDPALRRLLIVLLGSTLVEASNVVVNGKGRRYRGGWRARQVSAATVDALFATAVRFAAKDMAQFGHALRALPTVICADSRAELEMRAAPVDVALFSPPYPNSFDYTDVYNLELWMLGYLTQRASNIRLRQATLRSHVQVTWSRASCAVADSPLLKRTLTRLEAKRGALWDPRLVEMVSGYFADMATVLGSLRHRVRAGGTVIAVVGDSCYAGVSVDTVGILEDLARHEGFAVHSRARIRSMRRSAQHGGNRGLSEDCLVLRNPAKQ